MRRIIVFTFLFCVFTHLVIGQSFVDEKTEKKINELLAKMTLEEKIGQMTQRSGGSGLEETISKGQIGSILNEVNGDTLNKIQHLAVDKSRLGIPIIFGRDVIHGFRTIFPIPLGLAATWNPELVEQGTHISAIEAASVGIHWTFAPMMDIARDPRWGRIAESFGEDPFLASKMAVAMVKGFQGEKLSDPFSIAACAKHFACYGAAEGGRDYNTTLVPENEMRDVYLRPFEACVDANIATFMTAFNEINGVPASGNTFLLQQVLRKEWDFEGFVVSDWASITQMIPHGFCADDKQAAEKALVAGVDMEMATDSYEKNIKSLLDEKKISIDIIDNAVRNILRIKFALGLFDNPYTDASIFPKLVNEKHLSAAKKAACQSLVLLKNENHVLPLAKNTKCTILGPLADDPYEQLGTWVFDNNIDDSQTPLTAIRHMLGADRVQYVKVLETSRSKNTTDLEKAMEAVNSSDAVILILGEEAILSGEAHCRANINLPGAQEQLVKTVSETGKPVILVVIAGRPLTMGNILNDVDAILYSFHPGTMGGPAIADVLFGVESPSGKLPVTFPKVVGQIPIYYNHKNTGRPPREESWTFIDDIPARVWQTSLGNESHYLDAGFKPQYPFGYGLSYTTFAYKNIKLSSKSIKLGDSIRISADISNTGDFDAEEIVQLYTRDLVGDITRPVKELKGFKRIYLKAGETKNVSFNLCTKDLAFFNQKMQLVTEPGQFHVWIAPDSDSGLREEFEIVE